MTVITEISSELQHLMAAKKHLQPAALHITITTNEQKKRKRKKLNNLGGSHKQTLVLLTSWKCYLITGASLWSD